MFAHPRTRLAVSRFMQTTPRARGGPAFKLGDKATQAAMEAKYGYFADNAFRTWMTRAGIVFCIPAWFFTATLGAETCESLGLPWNNPNAVKLSCLSDNGSRGFWGKLFGPLMVADVNKTVTAVLSSAGTHTEGEKTYYNATVEAKGAKAWIECPSESKPSSLGQVWGFLCMGLALALGTRRYGMKVPEAAQIPYAVAGTALRTYIYYSLIWYVTVDTPWFYYCQWAGDRGVKIALADPATTTASH